MRALLFANGDPPSARLTAELAAGADLVIAADGGAEHALAHGLTPDAVVGDLDSVGEGTRAAVPADRFVREAADDRTDLEKTVAYALAHGATEIDIVAAGGKRADHALANLSVLVRFQGRAAIRIVDDLFAIEAVSGETTIDGPPGTVVSLVAIGPCRGVTTRGLRWELTDATLDFSARGVHNEIATSPASISVASGDLLLFRGRWIERHA